MKCILWTSFSSKLHIDSLLKLGSDLCGEFVDKHSKFYI